jgi:MFS family permease
MLHSMLIPSLSDRRRTLPGGRPFHLLLLSLAVSSCGDWLYNVALLALVYQRTGSATWVALTTVARVAPMLVLGPLGGALAGRTDRRRLMIASDLVRFGLMVALAAVAAAGLPIVLAPLLAAAAVAAATVQPSCVAASTARLVADEELQRANAVRAAISQGAIVAGPAIGAAILLLANSAVAMLLNGITFLVSAAAVGAIGANSAFRPAASPGGASSSCEARPGLLADVRSGAQALHAAPAAVRLIAADVICSAVYGLMTVTLVLLSRHIGAGDGGYGLLLGASGIGGIIGAAVTGRCEAPGRWRALLGAGLAVVGLALALLGEVPSLAGALALVLLLGMGMVVGEVLGDTALPRLLDDDDLARAYGFVMPASMAGIILGSLLAGPLVSLLGLSGCLAGAGGLVLAAAALLLRHPLVVARRVATGPVLNSAVG